MSFVISTKTLAQAWNDAQEIARQMKASAQSQRTASLAGPLSSTRILNFEGQIRDWRDRLDVIAALPQIGAYVSGLADTPQGYNVATEFAAMRSAIVATIDWIRTNYPRDTTNTYLLERQWSAGGLVERTFTTAALANYRTQLDALIAAIG